MRRVRELVVVVCVVVVVGVLFGGVGVACGASGWWHVTSGSRPSFVGRGVARSEVQTLGWVGSRRHFLLQNVASSVQAQFEWNATLGEVLAGFERLYGAGNVVVSGGPGDGVGVSPFVISFVGGLADQVVPAARVSSNELLMENGEHGSVSLQETVVGRPDGELVVKVENLGFGVVRGDVSTVVVRDTVPEGYGVAGVFGVKKGDGNGATPMSCRSEGLICVCEWGASVVPFAELEMRIAVVADGGARSGEDNQVAVSGGQVAELSVVRPVTLSSAPVPYGLEDYELLNEEEGGGLVTQAGAHPFQQTNIVDINQGPDRHALDELQPEVLPAGLAKDFNFKWPAGLIGNATVVARCNIKAFVTKPVIGGQEDECPADTAVGVAVVDAYEPHLGFLFADTVPLFNLETRVGEPARFGFFVPISGSAVYIDAAVRTGGDYGVTVSSTNITQTAAFLSAHVTVWGVPGDPRHDLSRGWACVNEELSCTALGEHNPLPFLSMPTSCSGPLASSVEGDSWQNPGVFEQLAGYQMPALDGCSRLQFAPQIKVSPDGQEASTPTGLTVDVHVPQEVNDTGSGLALSNIKNITVTLPEGVRLNPAAADGLQACSEEQVGFTGVESSLDLFTPTLPAGFCPNASKVATVRIKSPLLPVSEPLEGGVYLATPAPQQEAGKNPFAALVAMYIIAEDPVSGTLVKLPGRVSLDGQSGRITATFENNPQLAFEDAEVHFFGGQRAPLATPATCGSYITEATFTPWSGNPPVKSTSTFQVTSGPNASGCPNGLGFSPTLAAGSTNINAGSFSPLTTTISRPDGSQDIQTVKVQTPPGLSGILTGVKLCPQAQADAGTCGPQSLIGHTTVSVGLGGDPYTVTGGEVFLTEGYEGAPFGLSIVNPAVAGPFNLGKVIVRARIEVNPYTAALTVTTNSSGPYAIPRILDGIPLQIKHVNVSIDRPGFTLNPTNCNPMTLTATITSNENKTVTLSTPFQVTNCASLKFNPKFTATTSAKTSKKNGASLTLKVTRPSGPETGQANFAKAKIDLPKQLPSRLTTLQKACLAATFETNPALCSPASIVGHVRVLTPILPVPLEGPAYFVSHGGQAFPSLTFVLQGYGLTLDVISNTFIKNGITSGTLNAIPDAPFTTFELTLPAGPHSALAANTNLCTGKLHIPTAFVAQNNLEIHKQTPITVTGCPKKHTKTKHTHKPKTTTHKHTTKH